MARKKFVEEYPIRSSPAVLFDFCSNPSNMAQWFSDYADSDADIYTFGWDGGEYQKAEMLEWVEEEKIKYRWVTAADGEFFQFRIYKAEISAETILEVSFFAEEKEYKDEKFLLDNQVDDLRHALGAA